MNRRVLVRAVVALPALFAAAALARPVRAQTDAGVSVFVDHWKAGDSVSYDWGTTVGADLRFRYGEHRLLTYVTVGVAPPLTSKAPLYFPIGVGAVYRPFGDRTGLGPYGGLAGMCIVDPGGAGRNAAPGRGICGYSAVVGLSLLRDSRNSPFLEVQYSLKDAIKRVTLLFGVYGS